jgi:hypothetical protein
MARSTKIVRRLTDECSADSGAIAITGVAAMRSKQTASARVIPGETMMKIVIIQLKLLAGQRLRSWSAADYCSWPRACSAIRDRICARRISARDWYPRSVGTREPTVLRRVSFVRRDASRCWALAQGPRRDRSVVRIISTMPINRWISLTGTGAMCGYQQRVGPSFV